VFIDTIDDMSYRSSTNNLNENENNNARQPFIKSDTTLFSQSYQNCRIDLFAPICHLYYFSMRLLSSISESALYD